MSEKNWIALKVSDGTEMDAYVAAPKLPNRTGKVVVVLQEIFGVNDHLEKVCHRVALHGYLAIAPDMYHRTVKRLNLGYDAAGVAEGRKHKDQVTREGILADVQAAIGAFAADKFWHVKKAGVVGFCHGGHMAF